MKIIAILQFLFISILTINYISCNKLATKAKTKYLTSTKCSPLCLECSELDISMCNVCKTGVYQYNNLCYDKCPVGTYADQEWQVCRPCDSACPICWGPRSDQCGGAEGVQTTLVLLENEIKNYFIKKEFNNDDLISWNKKLNILINKVKDDNNLINFGNYARVFENNQEMMAPEDVYNSYKVEVELPIGSFSRNDGVFIPVPSLLNDKMELINSHWVYIKGNWNGRNWSENWFPKLPSFIKNMGEKSKIYFENGGYWIYEINQDWYWMKSTGNLNISFKHVNELLSDLNTMGDANNKRLKEKMNLRKLQIEDNIRDFFDKFSQNNKLIFSKLMNTVNNEENNIMGSLDFLKRRIDLFLSEEMLLNHHVGGVNRYPMTNANFRKNNETLLEFSETPEIRKLE